MDRVVRVVVAAAPNEEEERQRGAKGNKGNAGNDAGKDKSNCKSKDTNKDIDSDHDSGPLGTYKGNHPGNPRAGKGKCADTCKTAFNIHAHGDDGKGKQTEKGNNKGKNTDKSNYKSTDKDKDIDSDNDSEISFMKYKGKPFGGKPIWWKHIHGHSDGKSKWADTCNTAFNKNAHGDDGKGTQARKGKDKYAELDHIIAQWADHWLGVAASEAAAK